ncbi:MAG: N-acyl homoserine lactonase family protein [Betaproteobacteria bacterium]|nr:N-acyl homoserine lactonase family protein [Betaproteobacteria bacterium]
MKKSSLVAAAVGAALMAGSLAASAQVKQVYWTTSGFFGPFPITGLIPTIPKDKQRDITVPVSMWIIDHPKGLVIFDTGNNKAVSDSMSNCKSYWAPGNCDFLKPSQKAEDVIDMQIKKLGYDSSKVKVVITSHSHLDHIGNIEAFPNAIHVMQKKELYQAWFPEKFQGRSTPGTFVMADIDNAREFNYLELEGDYDLFGDGSVLILSTPGHTLGHQSVKLKLASGRSIIISQDAIWMQENLDGHPAGLNYSVKDYTASLNRLKFMRDLEGADLFMAHDQDQYAAKGGRWHK